MYILIPFSNNLLDELLQYLEGPFRAVSMARKLLCKFAPGLQWAAGLRLLKGRIALSLPSSQSPFSQPFSREMYRWGIENW